MDIKKYISLLSITLVLASGFATETETLVYFLSFGENPYTLLFVHSNSSFWTDVSIFLHKDTHELQLILEIFAEQ